MWIDNIITFDAGKAMSAVKNLSLSEEHLHDHFDNSDGLPALSVMPASLIIEGMAQTAGLLVGSVKQFKEKVILAKIQRAELQEDSYPGQCLRYDAVIARCDTGGASTTGIVWRLDHREGIWREIGQIDLMFSHIDNNLAGQNFPEHNFVFGENFHSLLRLSGMEEMIED